MDVELTIQFQNFVIFFGSEWKNAKRIPSSGLRVNACAALFFGFSIPALGNWN